MKILVNNEEYFPTRVLNTNGEIEINLVGSRDNEFAKLIIEAEENGKYKVVELI